VPGVEVRYPTALRRRLRVGREPGRDVDAHALDRAFGFFTERPFAVVEFKRRDAPRGVPRRLRERFRGMFFDALVRARVIHARSGFEVPFFHAEGGVRGGGAERERNARARDRDSPARSEDHGASNLLSCSAVQPAATSNVYERATRLARVLFTQTRDQVLAAGPARAAY
jgi:hypothetical protein